MGGSIFKCEYFEVMPWVLANCTCAGRGVCVWDMHNKICRLNMMIFWVKSYWTMSWGWVRVPLV